MIAAAELDAARERLKAERIDPLWLGNRHGEVAARRRVYRYLATLMDLEPDTFDLTDLTLDQLRQAWVCLSGVTYAEVWEWSSLGKRRR